jgi:hypothetical protein
MYWWHKRADSIAEYAKKKDKKVRNDLYQQILFVSLAAKIIDFHLTARIQLDYFYQFPITLASMSSGRLQ